MVLATLFWAGNYVIGAVAVQTMTPFDLTFLRWAIAVIPLFIVAQLVEKPDWRVVARAWPRMLVLGILGMLGYNLFLYEALNFTTPAGAALINAANPAAMALLAALLIGDKLTRRGIAGIVVSLVGVVVILSNGSVQTLLGLDINVGQLLMVLAVLVFSLYSIWGRTPPRFLGGGPTAPRVPPIAATAAQALIVLVLMAPFAVVNGVEIPVDPAPLSALLYIAVFPSVGSYLLWNLALRSTPASTAGIFLNLVTVFTVLIGLAVGQPVTLVDVVGGAIVIAGVLLTSLVPRSTRNNAAHPAVEPTGTTTGRGDLE